MIRNISNSSKNHRPLSTSQDSSKLKKSMSSSIKNKTDISIGSNSMNSSMKKPRLDTSKSSKKNNIVTSNSNKSLKALRENAHFIKSTTNNSTMYTDKKKSEKDEKKGAIMVKSIKNKIVGAGHANLKPGKENSNTSKKITKISYVGLSTEENAVHTPRTPTQKINQKSFNNFSIIPKRESESSALGSELSLDMFELGRKLGKGRFGDVYMAR